MANPLGFGIIGGLQGVQGAVASFLAPHDVARAERAGGEFGRFLRERSEFWEDLFHREWSWLTPTKPLKQSCKTRVLQLMAKSTPRARGPAGFIFCIGGSSNQHTEILGHVSAIADVPSLHDLSGDELGMLREQDREDWDRVHSLQKGDRVQICGLTKVPEHNGREAFVKYPKENGRYVVQCCSGDCERMSLKVDNLLRVVEEHMPTSLEPLRSLATTQSPAGESIQHLWVSAMSHVQERRSCSAAVRTADGDLWLLGGWDDDEPLDSVEILEASIACPRSPALWFGFGDDEEDEGQGGEGGEHANQSPEDDEEQDDDGDFDAGMEEHMHFSELWDSGPSLTQPRVFLGGALDSSGRVWAVGGGDSLYQGSDVFKTTEFLVAPHGTLEAMESHGAERDMEPDGIATSTRWVPGPELLQPRCGHGVVSLARVGAQGSLLVAGGYGGGTTYHKTVELLDLGRDTFTELAPMSVHRTGLGLSVGPDGCVYAAGGSPNGVIAHQTAERYDPRVGTWSPLPDMIFGRSYCSAAFGASGLLYLVGGGSSSGSEVRLVECFDPVAGRWRNVRSSSMFGMACADQAVIWSG